MVVRTFEDALKIIGEPTVDHRTKEEAFLFLRKNGPDKEISQLVEALRSDNFKVRWEAAKMLREMGFPALKGILHALVDPRKAGDTRFREGVYHVLHNHWEPSVRHMTAQLVQDLRGSAADLKTLHEAHHVLQQISDRERYA